MDFWEKIRKDLQRGIREGVAAVKEGATVLKGKAEELTEEGKRKYKIYDLKTKVQKEIAELGGRVYGLSDEAGNPLEDQKVGAIIKKIKILEARITRLEEKSAKASRVKGQKP